MTHEGATPPAEPQLLEPKEFQVEDASGKLRTYIISKFPAVAGREIIAKYPLTSLPKLSEYEQNEAVMHKLMGYVAVSIGERFQRLNTRRLIDSHIPDWETLAKVEMATIEYNCSFFLNGKASIFFAALSQKIPGLVSKILTDSLAQSSQAAKPPSTN